VPLALMVVEIVLGLGLPPSRAGAAVVIGGEMKDERLTLTVTAPPSAGPDASSSGMDLAHGFAGQLGGELDLSRRDGEVLVRGSFPCRPAPSHRVSAPSA